MFAKVWLTHPKSALNPLVSWENSLGNTLVMDVSLSQKVIFVSGWYFFNSDVTNEVAAQSVNQLKAKLFCHTLLFLCSCFFLFGNYLLGGKTHAMAFIQLSRQRRISLGWSFNSYFPILLKREISRGTEVKLQVCCLSCKTCCSSV